MSDLIAHAKKEFELLGWPGDSEMQKAMCDNILELLQVFSDQDHSGMSAGYCLYLFKELAKFNPLGPLTGQDDEWNEVGTGIYQNRRECTVFKENGQAYWMDGKIFRDPDGRTYTSKDSRVNIEFPWEKPKSEFVDVEHL